MNEVCLVKACWSLQFKEGLKLKDTSPYNTDRLPGSNFLRSVLEPFSTRLLTFSSLRALHGWIQTLNVQTLDYSEWWCTHIYYITLAFVLSQSSSFWGPNPQIRWKCKFSNMSFPCPVCTGLFAFRPLTLFQTIRTWLLDPLIVNWSPSFKYPLGIWNAWRTGVSLCFRCCLGLCHEYILKYHAYILWKQCKKWVIAY